MERGRLWSVSQYFSLFIWWRNNIWSCRTAYAFLQVRKKLVKLGKKIPLQTNLLSLKCKLWILFTVWVVIWPLSAVSWGAGMAQWWEHSVPTNVARVQFPDPVSNVGWVCWFSSLHQEVFSGYSSFPCPQKPKFEFDLIVLIVNLIYSVPD